mmetsp:Transcript_162325/g.287615  ORF Transcript_162325/g.287615 Transcript_162325/m.287615 type:complete len:206 (-) Transcript_162325:591-1208(-)
MLISLSAKTSPSRRRFARYTTPVAPRPIVSTSKYSSPKCFLNTSLATRCRLLIDTGCIKYSEIPLSRKSSRTSDSPEASNCRPTSSKSSTWLVSATNRSSSFHPGVACCSIEAPSSTKGTIFSKFACDGRRLTRGELVLLGLVLALELLSFHFLMAGIAEKKLSNASHGYSHILHSSSNSARTSGSSSTMKMRTPNCGNPSEAGP